MTTAIAVQNAFAPVASSVTEQTIQACKQAAGRLAEGLLPARSKPAYPGDMELACRIQARDESAAQELMQQHVGEMQGFARRMLSDSAEAEDVIQEALFGALKSMGRYDGRVSLRSWLYGILRNKISDSLRKRGRNLSVSSSDPEQDFFDGGGHWKEGASFAPFNENTELLQVVEGAMQDLPHNQREALALKAMQGLSSSEAAEIMNMTPVNFRQVLHRARQKLRQVVSMRQGQLGLEDHWILNN